MVKSSGKCRSNDLVQSVVQSHTSIVRPVKSFVLKSNTQFASRASNVFNRLGSLEMNHSSWMSHNELHESFEFNYDTDKNEEVFKKPFAPAPRKRKHSALPYKRDRKVWVKYSLKDTPVSSDATNAAVAFQFLDELRKKKEAKRGNEMPLTDDKLIFRKPAPKNSVISSPSLCVAHGSRKPPSVNRLNARSVPKIGVSIKLDHLQDDPDTPSKNVSN